MRKQYDKKYKKRNITKIYFALNILFILLYAWCVVEQYFLPVRKLQLQQMQLEQYYLHTFAVTFYFWHKSTEL